MTSNTLITLIYTLISMLYYVILCTLLHVIGFISASNSRCCQKVLRFEGEAQGPHCGHLSAGRSDLRHVSLLLSVPRQLKQKIIQKWAKPCNELMGLTWKTWAKPWSHGILCDLKAFFKNQKWIDVNLVDSSTSHTVKFWFPKIRLLRNHPDMDIRDHTWKAVSLVVSYH